LGHDHLRSTACRQEFEAAYKATGKRMDVGKSCVRFKKLDDLPLELIGNTIGSMSVDEFVDLVKKVTRTSKR
jgi:hypothetical protein